MKDGQEQQPLSERLLKQQQDAERNRKDLMASASECLKKDLDAMLTDARNTIAAGIRDLQLRTLKSIDSVNCDFQMKETKALNSLKATIARNNSELTSIMQQMSMLNNWKTLMIGLGLGMGMGVAVTLNLMSGPHLEMIKLPSHYVIVDMNTGEFWNCALKDSLTKAPCAKMEF